MSQPKIYIGLDVAKSKIDVCFLWPDGTKSRMKISNSEAGFRELMQVLHEVDLDQVHASFEATGPYSKKLGQFLFDTGMKVSRVNSHSVKSHGNSKKVRSKTDSIDAYLLADYTLMHQPPAWTPPTRTQEELRELQHRLSSIDEAIRQEENRLEVDYSSKAVCADIKENLGRLYVRKKLLEKSLKALVKTDARLDANYTILRSIVGLGDKSVIRLLALLHFEKFESGRQVGCFSGLTPSEHQSGTSIHSASKISRIGSSEIRAALYFPAMSAMQHNPQLRDFAMRLRERNKKPKVVICAVMRKLLVLGHSLIKNQTMYDPSYQSRMATD